MPQLCHCFATDINASACVATHETIRNHTMGGYVDVVHCDVALPLESRLRHGVDLIVFNPPYVVTPDEEIRGDGISAAWAGGKRGRRIIDKVLPRLSSLLSPGGMVYMIAIHDNDPAGTYRSSCICFLSVTVLYFRTCPDIIHVLSGLGISASIVAKQSADEELLYVIKGIQQ